MLHAPSTLPFWQAGKPALRPRDVFGDQRRLRARRGIPNAAPWTIERVDPIGNLKGSPGLYADAMNSAPNGGSEMFYDNIKVYANKK